MPAQRKTKSLFASFSSEKEESSFIRSNDKNTPAYDAAAHDGHACAKRLDHLS
jgi:hypothetical protein